MPSQEIKKVVVVGAGTMGQQISLHCARFGFDVSLYDLEPAALDTALHRQRALLEGFVAAGDMTGLEATKTLSRIHRSTDAAEVAAEADVLSESVPEDPVLKARVFAAFHTLCPERTVFTSNTSYLVPSMLAHASGRPERFAALHFHPPVWLASVVDIMPHVGTSPATVALLHGFAQRIGQTPIVYRKESPGYVVNAILAAMNKEALRLVTQGIASVHQVDRAWMGVSQMAVGPFGIMDSVGLDTVWTVTQFWARMLGDEQLQGHADFLKTYVERGELGLKSGRGFYSYPEPCYARAGFVAGDAGPTAP